MQTQAHSPTRPFHGGHYGGCALPSNSALGARLDKPRRVLRLSYASQMPSKLIGFVGGQA